MLFEPKMESLKDLLNSGTYDSHLQRRQKLRQTIRQGYRDDPAGAERVLAVLGEVYQRGKMQRFWDFAAALTGCDRGWGNATFLEAIQIFQEEKAAGSISSIAPSG